MNTYYIIQMIYYRIVHLKPIKFYLFFKDFIYLFLDRGEVWERNINVGASRMTPNGDLARNPGMYPDWESNWGPLGLQVSTQFTE